MNPWEEGEEVIPPQVKLSINRWKPKDEEDAFERLARWAQYATSSNGSSRPSATANALYEQASSRLAQYTQREASIAQTAAQQETAMQAIRGMQERQAQGVWRNISSIMGEGDIPF